MDIDRDIFHDITDSNVRKTLERMISNMATYEEALTSLTAKVDGLVTSVTTTLDEVRADVDNLKVQLGQVTPEQQAALDAITGKLDSATAALEGFDADENFPPVTPPEEPPA